MCPRGKMVEMIRQRIRSTQDGQVKTCNHCLNEKPITSFPRKGLTSTGRPHYRAQCLTCYGQQQKEQRRKHQDRYTGYSRASYRRNRTKLLQVARERRQQPTYQQYTRSYLKQWRRKNKELLSEGVRRFHNRNPHYRAEYNTQYRHAHGDRLRAYDRQRYQSPMRREAAYAAQAKRRALILGAAEVAPSIRWKWIIERDHSTCYICQRQLERTEITFDHYIPLAKGGAHTETNLRVACRACNGRKSDKMPSSLGL